MPTVRFEPDGVDIDIKTGKSLLDGALKAGIPHTHACGGNARCTTCRVMVLEGEEHLGEPTWKETRVTRRLGFTSGFRLACQAKVKGDCAVRRLVLDPEDVAIVDARDAICPIGVEKPVSVLFSDIRDFTPLAESLLPYDVIHLLNRHFFEMSRIIEDHGGTITAYMGDGLMALFGADDAASKEEPVHAAVRAGLDMLARQHARTADLERLYGQAYAIGVGVHTGSAVVGSLGGEMRVMTAIGDVVNVASRVESATKNVGAELLISEPTYEGCADAIEVGRRVRLRLKGKTGEHTLYEVLGPKPSGG